MVSFSSSRSTFGKSTMYESVHTLLNISSRCFYRLSYLVFKPRIAYTEKLTIGANGEVDESGLSGDEKGMLKGVAEQMLAQLRKKP